MQNETIDKLKNAGYITVTDDSQGIADKVGVPEAFPREFIKLPDFEGKDIPVSPAEGYQWISEETAAQIINKKTILMTRTNQYGSQNFGRKAEGPDTVVDIYYSSGKTISLMSDGTLVQSSMGSSIEGSIFHDIVAIK